MPGMARWAIFDWRMTEMILALVDNDRHTRRQLRMIIRPLSDEFIDSSPEAVPPCCYRLEPRQSSAGAKSTEQLDKEG
ncbi:MAG: hypothetical protein GY814_04855 [Gammaproteobacteria bacterium]|nr:hypothetical protein [Gammaproteobacteria bacterium]